MIFITKFVRHKLRSVGKKSNSCGISLHFMHRTSGAIRVPLGSMKPLERLRKIESDYKLYHERGLDKLMHRILFPPGSLIPTKIFVRVYETIRRISRLGALFTSVAGFHDDFYSIGGQPIISVSPLLGMLGLTPGK